MTIVIVGRCYACYCGRCCCLNLVLWCGRWWAREADVIVSLLSNGISYSHVADGMATLRWIYFSLSSEMLNRSSSHMWGRWYLPMFLLRDGLLKQYIYIYKTPLGILYIHLLFTYNISDIFLQLVLILLYLMLDLFYHMQHNQYLY